jgi:mannan endo-1,4-beta-mannosidase
VISVGSAQLARRVGLHVAAVVTIAVGAALFIAPAPALSVGASAPAAPTALAAPNLAAHPPSKKALLNPAHKYFGVFIQGAPHSLSRLDSSRNPESVKAETGKTPNLDMWFQAWDADATSGKSNFPTRDARAACSAGILPMMTWESWNTSVTSSANPGPAYAQKAFAAKTVTSGKYDIYIRNTALAIKSAGCPVAIRFDQEANGYWYPWGLTNQGMGSLRDTPKQYIAMWRHVWNVFHTAGATNVLWVWSPNILSGSAGQASLKASYPGSKYVDEVGIDGYFFAGTPTTFATRFGPTMAQLKFAKAKRWMIAETAVGGAGPQSSNITHKPTEITNLLDAVAANKQFNGLVYFDQFKSTAHANWLLNENAASERAFKAAINKKTYASAKPGTL